MALLNFAGSGSYSVVVPEYDKHNRYCHIKVLTYSDSTKTTLLFSHTVACLADCNDYPEVLGIMEIPPALETRVNGDKWIVPADLSVETYPEFTNFNTGDTVATWEALGQKWGFDRISEGSLVKFDGEGVKKLMGGEFVAQPLWIGATEFDAALGIAAITGTDKNILSACYNYLKTLPAYAHCSDG